MNTTNPTEYAPANEERVRHSDDDAPPPYGDGSPRPQENAALEIAKDVGKGLAILVAAPVVIAGTVAAVGVVGAGGILYGAGKVVQGVGNALSFGLFREDPKQSR
ncbi:hypothetical protein BDN72DRAFT_843004 [Pluteus cervinus]|uniref:Uncharacterized protein n=1 Tax=Pluteus cervinus TaxID=181527 RepID=A0ACD3AP60_9AGAR|nr:hypothetical protein BDN72DRAFT_843004 [Pluteus cervinus]